MKIREFIPPVLKEPKLLKDYLMRSNIRKSAPDIVFFVLLVITIIVIVRFYVSKEHYFYFWDFVGYQLSTINQVNNFLKSPIVPVKAAIESLGEDYNALFTLPLVPVMLVFGNTESRSTYILSLALVYFLPFSLVIGLIAKKLIPTQRQRAVFWSAVLVAVLSPTAWLPTLRGYPDTGGAVLIALAILTYVHDERIKKWWQILLIGIFLSSAVLFRRHFGYGVTAFFASILIMVLIRAFRNIQHNPSSALRELAEDGVRIGLVVFVILVFLFSVGRSFTFHVLTQNFRALYSSWEVSPQKVFQIYPAYYGWLALLFACVGLVAGSFMGVLTRRVATFIGLFVGVAFLQWLLIVRQINPHYTLHFTVGVLLGIVAFIWLIWARFKVRWRGIGNLFLVGYFLINTIFWMMPQTILSNQFFHALFPADVQPLEMPDYREIVRLVDDLRARASNREPIYVVDSSGDLNNDLLKSAEHILYPRKQILNILASPQVDSRDYYPIETLLTATYVVVSTPLQRHLALSEQGVVSSVYDAFVESWEISKDFTRLPETYSLMYGVNTRIYKRIRVTSLETAIQTLYQIQQLVGPRPGGQMDWVRMDNIDLGSLSETHSRDYRFRTTLSARPGRDSQTILYLGPIPDHGEVSGGIVFENSGCANVRLSFAAAGSDGEIFPFAEINNSPEMTTVFSQDFSSNGLPYLMLSLSLPIDHATTGDTCKVTIENLSVSGKE